MDNKHRVAVSRASENYQIEYPLIRNKNRPFVGWYKPKINKIGYPHIGVRIRGLKIDQKIEIHRVVAHQKYGDEIFKEGIHVRHLDNDKLNFHPDNLALGTAYDNHHDNGWEVKELQKKEAKAAAKALRKLTMEQANNLRQDRENGMYFRDLAKKYKISLGCVCYICQGKTYNE